MKRSTIIDIAVMSGLHSIYGKKTSKRMKDIIKKGKITEDEHTVIISCYNYLIG
jgi:hypothetical protein